MTVARESEEAFELDAVNRRILKFIIDQQKTRGFPPTVRELCAHVKHDGRGGKGTLVYSTSSMHTRLRWMASHGVISWDPRSPRTIRVLDPG